MYNIKNDDFSITGDGFKQQERLEEDICKCRDPKEDNYPEYFINSIIQQKR